MIKISFSLFHDMIDLRKTDSFTVFFKTWRRKAIPREKKSNVKLKYEKEIVQNYSDIGKLEKMY